MSTHDPLLDYLDRPTRRRFARVVEAHQEFVWSVAWRSTRHATDAADIAQDVFLRLLIDPPARGAVTSPRAWLAWRTIGRAGHFRRAEERRRARERQAAASLLPGHDPASADDLDALWRTIEMLPEEHSRALELELGGLSQEEIAALLGCSARTVRRRIAEARDTLRRRLSGTLFALLVSGRLAAAPSPSIPIDLATRLIAMSDAGRALAAIAAGASTASSTPVGSPLALGGILLMKKAIIAAAAAALALVGTWIWLDRATDRSDPSPRVASTERATSVESPSDASAPNTSEEKDPTAADASSDGPSTDGTPALPVLVGRVTDANGDPVRGARIAALDLEEWLDLPSRLGVDERASDDAVRELESLYRETLAAAPSAETDDDGRYVIASLRSGTYRVAATADGRSPVVWPEIAVATGVRTTLDFTLPAALSIRGAVRRDDGGPYGGAIVGLTAPTTSTAERIAAWRGARALLLAHRTEASPDDGAFALSPLDPGVLSVWARAPRGTAMTERPRVEAGESGVVLVLPGGANISGRVLDANRLPVAGANIEIARRPSRSPLELFDARIAPPPPFGAPSDSTVTDEIGRFGLALVATGTWRLVVRAEGAALEERVVDVAAGADVDVGDIELETGRSVSGFVVDPDGAAVPGATVAIVTTPDSVQAANIIGSPEPLRLAETTSAADGSFVLHGVGRSATFLATKEGHADSSVTTRDDDVRLVLRRGASLWGRVVDDRSGRGVSEAEVIVGFDRRARARTGRDGGFEVHGIDLAAATHGQEGVVWVEHPDYGRTRESFVLASRSPASPITVRLSPGTWLEGRAADARGEPIRGATIRYAVAGMPEDARGWSPVAGLSASTDDDGRFRLATPQDWSKLIGSPRLWVLASHPGHAVACAGPLDVPESGSAWPWVELTLDDGGSVRGVIRDAQGRPVARAIVALSPRPCGEEPVDDAGNRALYATTDDEGRYAIDRVPLAPFTATARRAGEPGTSVEGDARGGDVTLDIALHGGQRIEGRVVDDRGEPVSGAEVVSIAEPLDARTDSAHRSRLLLEPGHSGTITNPVGAFGLLTAPGPTRLVARAPGHEPALVSVAEGEKGEEEMEIVLERHGALGGIASDANGGAPIPDLRVNVISIDRRAAAQKASRMEDYRLGSEGELRFVGDAGRWRVPGLRAGAYEVRAHAAGRVTIILEVTLTAGESRRLDLAFERGAHVEGRVVAASDGRPIADARVSLLRTGTFDFDPAVATTDENGHYSYGGLSPGDYRVAAAHPLWLPDLRSVSIPQDLPVEIELESAARIEGRIGGLDFGAAEGLQPRWTLRLDPEDDAAASATRPAFGEGEVGVDERGTFRSRPLRPGHYRLRLVRRLERHGEIVETGPGTGFGSVEQVGEPELFDLGPIELAAGEFTVIERELER